MKSILSCWPRSISSGFLSTSKSDCRMLPSTPVFDSVSIGTTFKEDLLKAGVVFCSISEAVRDYPELVKEHLGSVVPVADNYFTALNSAVFRRRLFVYIPKGVISPMELSTYFASTPSLPVNSNVH